MSIKKPRPSFGTLQTNAADDALIGKIVQRYKKIARDLNISSASRDAIETVMDLAAVHYVVAPLDLQRLLDAREEDLMHDILGIYKHLDRENWELMDFFWPRFALRQEEK